MLPHSGCRTAVPILLVYDGARGHRVGVTAETSVNNNLVRLLLQLIERGENIFTVPARVNIGVRSCDFAGRVDEEGMPRRKFCHSEVRQRPILPADFAVAVG